MELFYFLKNDCVPCAEKKPVAMALAEVSGLTLTFINAEHPNNAELVAACKVKAVPTLCVMDNGKRLFGFYGKLIEQEKILRLLGK